MGADAPAPERVWALAGGGAVVRWVSVGATVGLLLGVTVAGCSESDDAAGTAGVDTVSSDASGGDDGATPGPSADVSGGEPPDALEGADVAVLADTDGPGTDVDSEAPPDIEGDAGTAAQDVSDAAQPGDSAVTEDTGPDDAGAPFVLDCPTYCDAVAAACTDVTVYDDVQDCLAACEAFPLGIEGASTGHSVSCRYGRALLAAEGGPQTTVRCLGAGPAGGGVCGQPCEAYCDLLAAFCPAQDTVDCEAACPSIPTDGSIGDDTGDHLACRFEALFDGRCADAALDGGVACAPALPPGDTCAAPWVADALPYVLSGNTAGALDDLAYAGGVCGGEFGGKGGQGAVDHVVRFDAGVETVVTATLKGQGGYDPILYVLSDCADPTASCLDKKDSVGFNATEVITTTVPAGGAVYFVIDGANGAAGEGAYSFTLDEGAP